MRDLLVIFLVNLHSIGGLYDHFVYLFVRMQDCR